MCGIIASIKHPLSINTINQVMGHRGPDERNEYKYNDIHFYHLRLSIQDVAGGKQPMRLGDRYTIIFNGEIYNHKDLRKKFNLSCKTNSDTETLLHLYDKLGVKFLDELDGMFAFILLDKVKNILFVARDRAGKKPLYYYKNEGKLILASELNALKALLPLEINENNISQYFRFGFMYKENTPYLDVKEVEGGSYLLIDINTLEIKKEKWWNIHDLYTQPNSDSFDLALEKVDSYLDKAVQRRVEASDLEVGSFLSGGIDSGLVTAIASKYNKQLRTFTVSFQGQYDEAPLAKLVAAKYGTKHEEIHIAFDHLKDDVENIIGNYGEPYSDSSAIPSYYVSQAAKKHLTVVLNGDGADELFGGYRRYVPFAKYDFLNSSAFVKGSASFLKALLPLGNNKRSKYSYIYRLLELSSKKGVNTYLSSTSDIFEGFEQYLPTFNCPSFMKDFEKISASSISGLSKLMNLDFEILLFGDLLVKMDIATMAHSLEGRSPFLAKELLEYAPTMSANYKIKGTQTKYLLRKLAEKYLPDELINQPKRGFEIPLKDWVENDLKELILDRLTSENNYSSKFVDKIFIQNLINNKLKVSGEKRAKMLWVLFCLEIWYAQSGKTNYFA
ncbi:MAG: asparagine synthase (glutamine-hydrolyzing) [Saprospiraceae bacterium]|nr:asparagine synthase (glutamine-hydrolyzing) [Saprospiraceae bacterium]